MNGKIMDSPGTVLFDLDGTLVPIDLDFFHKHYVREACARFSALIPPRLFTEALIDATRRMVSDLDPGTTNREAFARCFSDRVGIPWSQIWPLFEDFYANEFRQLRRFVPENAEARAVVTRVVEAGWKIVLATNPIFPEIAVRERMRWAGVEDLPWLYVTTLDNMHFCKPHLEYYREIVEILRLDPSRCVMVGNDVEEDMVAKRLGMKTFLVEDFLIERGGSGLVPDGRGKLRDLLPFLEGLLGCRGTIPADGTPRGSDEG